MDIIKIENGQKKLLIVASTEEEKDWLKSMGENVQVQLITEQGHSVLGTPVTGSLLLTQKTNK